MKPEDWVEMLSKKYRGFELIINYALTSLLYLSSGYITEQTLNEVWTVLFVTPTIRSSLLSELLSVKILKKAENEDNLYYVLDEAVHVELNKTLVLSPKKINLVKMRLCEYYNLEFAYHPQKGAKVGANHFQNSEFLLHAKAFARKALAKIYDDSERVSLARLLCKLGAFELNVNEDGVSAKGYYAPAITLFQHSNGHDANGILRIRNAQGVFDEATLGLHQCNIHILLNQDPLTCYIKACEDALKQFEQTSILISQRVPSRLKGSQQDIGRTEDHGDKLKSKLTLLTSWGESDREPDLSSISPVANRVTGKRTSPDTGFDEQRPPTAFFRVDSEDDSFVSQPFSSDFADESCNDEPPCWQTNAPWQST
jgi:hypothetical protein